MSENEILARGIVAGMAIVLPFLGIAIARWHSWKGWSKFWQMMHKDLQAQNERLFETIKTRAPIQGGRQMSELEEHLFCECDECIRVYRGPLSNEMCPYYLKSEADKVIVEKDTEIAELKAEIKRKETVGQMWFERCMEARTENVGLERAIWLARAERYKMKEFIAREEGNLSNLMSWSRVLRERTYNQWVDQLLRIANLANKLQNKCRAKAEKFKEADK